MTFGESLVGNKHLRADSTSTPAEADEKEKFRQTIGSIGGRPRLKGKVLNVAFVVAVFGAFAMSLVSKGVPRVLCVDIAILLLSLKFAYHLHTEAKVNHAQFWILTTIEDRILDLIKELRQLRREFRDSSPAGGGDLPELTPSEEAPKLFPED